MCSSLSRMLRPLYLLTTFTAYVACSVDINTDPLVPSLVPGAIKTHIGEVKLIQDYLAVTISHKDTTQFPEFLLTLLQQTDNVLRELETLKNTTGEIDGRLINEILIATNNTHDKIKEALLWFPDQRLNNRPERGLINVVGIALKYLFGTAAEGDITKLEERLTTLQEMKDRDHRIIEGLTSSAKKQRDKINELIENFNEASQKLVAIKDNQLIHIELNYISLYMNNILKEVELVISEVRHHIDDLALASKGIVTSNIISINELILVLHEAKLLYSLDPVFLSSQLANYYYVMNVLFAPQTIILQIPMSSQYRFTHFRFKPFPTYHINETLILLTNKTELLVSHDKRYFSEANLDDFEVCQTVQKLKLCPSNIFTLHPSLSKQTCLRQLLFSELLSADCAFRQVVGGTFSEVVPPVVFVTRDNDRPSHLRCMKTTNMTHARTLVFPEDCTFEDNHFIIIGRRPHQMHLNRNPFITNFYPFHNMTFNRSSWQVIRPLDNVTLWTIISQPVMKVVIPVTFLIVVLTIIFLVVFIFLFLKLKYGKSNDSSNQQTLPVSEIRHVAK